MRKLWLIYVLLCFCLLAEAQNPIVNFAAFPTTGCAPLVVTFTDQSTGNPTNWDWDLGNGQLSTARNPVVVYNIPGTYTVKLVVRNANGIAQATKTDLIVVNPTPTAAFTAGSTTGCAPNTISFSDLSSAPGSNITGWQWNFGDGTTSTAQNPSHVYQAPGFYDVSLQVTSSQGCRASSIRSRYIRIVPGVVANFSQVPANTCEAPYNLSLTNQSSGPGNLSYSWTLGNGTTSTVPSPSTVYNTAGSYPIRLITTSDYGCSDTLDQNIVLTDNITQFSAPDTSCLNVGITFTNTSTPNPISSRWDFGNGSTSNSRSPSYVFDSTGVFTVKLINNYGNCIDSVSKTVVVGPKPYVDFTSVVNASCRAPFTVEFQDLTSGSSAWFWSFGDGTNSTEKNPRHTYNSLGEYDVTLTATFGGGCQNTLVKPVFVKVVEPTVAISNMPVGGCIPYTFAPVADIRAVDGVASYLWDFGDGATSTAASPSHTYANTGSYNIRLTITTNSGCTATVNYPDGVKTGTPVTVDFTADKFSVCASQAVQFTAIAPGADEFLWDFGDGAISDLRDPIHVFEDTGFVNVRLRAFSNRCPSEEIKPRYIRVDPPIARFSYSVDCNNKLLVNFRDSSIVDQALGNITYSWTFGGTVPGTSTLKDPSFTFAELGSHKVTLTVTNGPNCSFTYDGEILLTDEIATFESSKRVVCKDEEFTLTATPPDPKNIKFYEWTVGTNAPVLDTSRSYKTRLADGGLYDVRLVIIDTNFCRDTLVSAGYMEVVGPDPDFGPDVRGTCPNVLLNFTDRTVSVAPVVKWTWEYGDGTVTDYTAPPFTHRYQKTGVFGVRLTVTDSRGCRDSKFIEDTVIVTSPVAGFLADTVYCPGVPLNYTDTSVGRNLSYLWNLGNGGTSTVANPTNIFPVGDALYNVSLKITDEFGCSDSVSKAAYIKIRSPKAAFSVVDTTSLCPPLESRFTLEAKDYKSYYWDFGDGSSQSNVPNPRHFYNGYNVYTATLVAEGFGGCVDSAIHRITISDPGSTVLTYDPLQACNVLTANFQIKVPPYSRYVFYYGDGNTNTSQDTAFSRLLRGPAFFYPSIFLTDSSGCQISLTNYEPIRVIGARPLYGANKKEFCDTAAIAFTNFTIFNDPVVSYNWSFGDGGVSNDFSPSHFYAVPGTNVVKLTVITEQGCTDSLTDTIRAYRTPVATIRIPDTVCLNTPTLFQGLLAAAADTNRVNWQWSFGNGQSATVQNPGMRYTAVGDYTVNLKTSVPFGCASDTSKRIYVPPSPTVEAGPDIQIISGGGAMIPAVYTGRIADYRWAPGQRLDCDDCPAPYANPVKTTKYKITATDIYGCMATDDVTIFVVCSDRNLYIPNTFSPNSDGVNDAFYPRGTGVFTIKSMRVFNRWGETVFERTNFNANAASSGWDGNYNGKRAPQDTYVYTMEIVCENSEISTFKGNVTLIR